MFAISPHLIADNFYEWRDLYPELEVLYRNQDLLREELENIPKWVPWPEDHFSLAKDDSNTRDWTVFPLLHTFPAYDTKKMKWVESTCQQCPKTYQ